MTEASLAQDRRPSGIDREQAIRANIVVHTKMSESYNENEPHFRPENKAIVRSILEDLAHRTQGGRLVDLGCGTGFIIDLARDLFQEIDGVDITPAMLAKVDATQGTVTLHESQCESLPFADESFDVATAYSFLDHVSDYRLVFVEAARVLRPGGYFYADLIPNRAFWGAISDIERRYETIKSPYVHREIQANLHQHEQIDQHYDLEPGTFLAAEPWKTLTGGLDLEEVRDVALASGFSDVVATPHWFLAQGPVMHRQSFEDAETIDRYLTTILPMSLHLYKYLRFVMAR